MYDLDKISQDIDLAVKKCGSWRAAVKATGINKASLENYYAKTTKEPREPNIRKLAIYMHKDITCYYKIPNSQATEPAQTQDWRDEELYKSLRREVDFLRELVVKTRDEMKDLNIRCNTAGENGDIKLLKKSSGSG
jgi:ribosomal protein S6